MNVMVLAAGYGKRMGPLTERTPKPALPVLGRPLILQILRYLFESGVDELIVNLHHQPEQLRETIDKAGPGHPRVHFSEEPELLGTGGALRRARSCMDPDQPLLVVNSDQLCDVDIGRLVQRHRERGAAATLAVIPPRSGYGVVDVDDAGRVRALAGLPEVPGDVPTTPRLFTGCHVLDPRLVDEFPDGEERCIRELYRRLAAEGVVHAIEHDGFWWEFGTPQLYLSASLELLRAGVTRGRRLSEHDPVRWRDGAPIAMGAGTRIASDAEIVGATAIGFASEVRSGARLKETIVMPEAWVGPGAQLERVIVASGVEVPTHFVARDAVLAAADASSAGLPRVLPFPGTGA